MKKRVLTIVGTVLCAILLVAGSVMGTIAYLTSTATVTNTFTVGDVDIDLSESLVTLDGKPVAGADRVHINEYHLVPDVTYTKDPRITIKAGSEPNFIFVKIINGFANTSLVVTAKETQDDQSKKTIATQLKELGWVSLIEYAQSKDLGTVNGANDIYVFLGGSASNDNQNVNMNANLEGVVEKSADTIHIQVFKTFTVSKHANLDELTDTDGNGKIDPKIEVTAYAVQATGFTDAVDAWNSTFGNPDGLPTETETETTSGSEGTP